jgi:hypothetical protein
MMPRSEQWSQADSGPRKGGTQISYRPEIVASERPYEVVSPVTTSMGPREADNPDHARCVNALACDSRDEHNYPVHPRGGRI